MNRYFKALVENDHRFNLVGHCAEEISSDHKEYAKATLEARAATKAKRQAEKAQKIGIVKKNSE